LGYLPIEDHGIIGDLHTAALVGTDGTIDWLCLPDFDSPSVFCSILDDEKGGSFRLRPVEYVHSHQLYLPDTNVLITRFFSSEGMAETLDFMPILSRRGERHRLVRNVRIVRGRMTFDVECRPAFDYAREGHSVFVGKLGAVFVSEGSYHPTLGLSTEVPLEKRRDGGAGTRFTLGAGERTTFVLAEIEEGEEPAKALSDWDFDALLRGTLEYWRRWVASSWSTTLLERWSPPRRWACPRG
jgi:GH15 family glucan-1,4-alpha-glucosidase